MIDDVILIFVDLLVELILFRFFYSYLTGETRIDCHPCITSTIAAQLLRCTITVRLLHYFNVSLSNVALIYCGTVVLFNIAQF